MCALYWAALARMAVIRVRGLRIGAATLGIPIGLLAYAPPVTTCNLLSGAIATLWKILKAIDNL